MGKGTTFELRNPDVEASGSHGQVKISDAIFKTSYFELVKIGNIPTHYKLRGSVKINLPINGPRMTGRLIGTIMIDAETSWGTNGSTDDVRFKTVQNGYELDCTLFLEWSGSKDGSVGGTIYITKK